MTKKTIFLCIAFGVSYPIFSMGVFSKDNLGFQIIKNKIDEVLSSLSHKEKVTLFGIALINKDPILAEKIINSDLKNLINEKSLYGYTALDYIIKEEGNINLALKLLENGADPNILDEYGQTILEQIYLNKQENPSKYRQEIFDLLINHKSINIDQQDKIKQTILHLATFFSDGNSIDTIKKALQKNADPNIQDINGHTALHLLAESPPLLCCGFASQLLAYGADPNIKDINRCTPLLLILKSKYFNKFYRIESRIFKKEYIQAVKIINKVENKNTKSEAYSNCFFDETIDALINHGKINLDMQDPINGKTALHYAAEFGDFKILSRLLKPGVNIDIFDKQGMTPLDYARKENKNKSSQRDYAISIKLLSDYTQQSLS